MYRYGLSTLNKLLLIKITLGLNFAQTTMVCAHAQTKTSMIGLIASVSVGFCAFFAFWPR